MPTEDSKRRVDAARESFAKKIAADAGLRGPSEIRVAFASTPRERFLGKGPWTILTREGFTESPSDDPELVYCDAPIAIDRQKGINNGQPSLYARCFAALNIQPGETVTHVGAGTGYYTAILAKLTGSRGVVHAFEIDDGLAQRAAENLAELANVTVYARSGSADPLPDSDVVYVSAGATAPQRVWLEALRGGGRLLFPLTDARGAGAVLMITRTSSGAFRAEFVSSVMFIPCVGARDEATEARLGAAFERGDVQKVRSLRLRGEPDQTCWFAGRDWWLSTAEVG
jgi:protein-L-isoaspartate(D-aspartate) O-methyltransferase